MNESSTPTQANSAFIILISCIATIGGFLFGFDSGVINGTVDGLQTAFNSDSMGTGFSVSSMLLGCAVGAFFAGTLADKHGRRALLIVAAVLFCVRLGFRDSNVIPGVHLLPHSRRSCRRRGERHVSGLYQ